MTEGMYVVSVREGAGSYDSAIYFPPGESMEADADELAASLAKSTPGATHHVVTGEEFARGFEDDADEFDADPDPVDTRDDPSSQPVAPPPPSNPETVGGGI